MAKWNLDPPHTSVEFSVRHLGVAWVKGHFMDIKGSAEFDPAHPEKAFGEVEIEAKSIWTNNEMRDNHLRSKDFFNVEQYPLVTFKSTGVEKISDREFRATGDLTMRGITRPVTLAVEFFGIREVPSGDGKTRETHAGFSAKTTVNRHDFGISWDAPIGGGITTVGGEVDVIINAEAIRE